jgi:hypothetical protein
MSGGDIAVLVIVTKADEALRRIAAVDPRIRLVYGRCWFDDEYRVRVRDRVFACEEMTLGGWPFPPYLPERSKRLRWFHQVTGGGEQIFRVATCGTVQ